MINIKRLLVLTTLVLGIAGLLLFNRTVFAGHHNEWGDWEIVRQSQCEPVSDECGVSEGNQTVVERRDCIEVDGHGEDECDTRIWLPCPEGYVWSDFFKVCYNPRNWSDTVDRPYEDIPAEETRVTENVACKVKEPLQCGTERWCVEYGKDGHDYQAQAIPTNEEPPEGSFPWEEGMDEWCEFPEVPVEPEPEPQPENLAPACPDHVVPPVPTNVYVERNGADATVHWTPQGGDLVNIYILTPEGVEVGAIGDTPNDGVETVHDLNPTGDYNFELEAHQGCAGGERVRIGVIDSYLPMTFFASYARLVR